MQIDWFTFVAQLINFLILLYLLKRFLYGPILRAVDERQRKIAARLDDAEQARQEAAREVEEYRDRRRQLEESRDELLAEARRAAEERKRELLAQVRDEAAEARQLWHEAIEREKRNYLEELRDRLGRHVFETARKVLAELAGEDLERRMLQAFLERLEKQAVEEEALSPAALQDAETVRLISSFSVAEADRGRLREALETVAGQPLQLEYESDPEAICGIEVRAGGMRIAWSVRDSIESLEEIFFSTADRRASRPEPSRHEANET